MTERVELYKYPHIVFSPSFSSLRFSHYLLIIIKMAGWGCVAAVAQLTHTWQGRI